MQQVLLFSTAALWNLLGGEPICVKAPIQAVKPWGEREGKEIIMAVQNGML